MPLPGWHPGYRGPPARLSVPTASPGEVGDQAVHAEVGQAAHQRRFVDRPDRHVQACLLCLEQALRGAQGPVQREHRTAVVGGHLQRVEPVVFGDQAARQLRRQATQGTQHLARAAGDGDPVLDAETLGQRLDGQHGACGAYPRGALDFQLPVLERALLEQALQRRDRAGRLPARAALAGVELHQFLGIVLHHLAAAAGGALEGRVVDHHQLAVTR